MRAETVRQKFLFEVRLDARWMDCALGQTHACDGGILLKRSCASKSSNCPDADLFPISPLRQSAPFFLNSKSTRLENRSYVACQNPSAPIPNLHSSNPDHIIPFRAPWKKNRTMKTCRPAIVTISPLSIKLKLKMRFSVLLTVLKLRFSRVRKYFWLREMVES